MKDVGPIEDYLELWYVNMNGAKDRQQCMEKQIEEMSLKPNRYNGLNFHQCTKKSGSDPALVKCLTLNGYGDCVKKGIQAQGIMTHGSKAGDDIAQQYHIISNACGHKRLMSHLMKRAKEGKSK